MKKLTAFIISSTLLFGAVACSDTSRTSGAAPENPDNNQVTANTPTAEVVNRDLKDAQSETRRNQLNSDIRAREQRNNIANQGGATNRAENDLASEVRSKLEANIPNGQLTVEATEQGAVIVAGTVPNPSQLAKIERLAREIKGVTSVTVNAVIAPPQSTSENSTQQ